MKKLLIIFLFPVLLSAQADKQQALELPDFIITGTRGIDVPILQKKKPKLIPVLANDFFMPVFSPEDFAPAVLSSPYEKELKLVLPQTKYEGKAVIGIGRYTMPAGEFSLMKNYSGFILNLNAMGSNISNYEPNSGYNNSLISLGGDYFIKGGGDFFNGTKLSFNARYFRNSYKMFASLLPDDERNGHLFGGSASISNNAFKYLSYGIEFDAHHFIFNYLDTKETSFSLGGNAEYKSSAFNLAGKIMFRNESVSNSRVAGDNYSMLTTEGLLKVKPVSGVEAGVGLYMANYNKNDFLMLKGSLQMILNDNVTLFADFSPEVEFLSFYNIVSINRYSDFVPVLFQKKEADLKISLRYEYGKYFDITGGIGYASYDKFVYFQDLIWPGTFNPLTTGAKRFYSYLKMYFHPGPFGRFYGEVNFQDLKDDNSRYIPHQPAVDASLTYGFDFDNGLGFIAMYDIQFSAYTDGLNTDKLPAMHNISVGLSYKVQENFLLKLDLQNITNNRNYYFKGYLEKPFDIVAGVEYRW